MSSDKEKGSRLSPFQKVKLLSYVSQKPTASSRPASTLRIYSLEVFHFPAIARLKGRESAGPVCREGTGDGRRWLLQYPTSARLVSPALGHLPAPAREALLRVGGSVLVPHPTARWSLAGLSAVAFSPGARGLGAGCKARFKLRSHFGITRVKHGGKAWSCTVPKIRILNAGEGEKAPGRNQPRGRRCQDGLQQQVRICLGQTTAPHLAPSALRPPDSSGKCPSCSF